NKLEGKNAARAVGRPKTKLEAKNEARKRAAKNPTKKDDPKPEVGAPAEVARADAENGVTEEPARDARRRARQSKSA
ncbi:MAG: hypothetical protein HKN26_05425, partial [Acidimicrobiales bacterium]|nr:hypothetical protein [Acidimicrobiales bacterium]